MQATHRHEPQNTISETIEEISYFTVVCGCTCVCLSLSEPKLLGGSNFCGCILNFEFKVHQLRAIFNTQTYSNTVDHCGVHIRSSIHSGECGYHGSITECKRKGESLTSQDALSNTFLSSVPAFIFITFRNVVLYISGTWLEKQYLQSEQSLMLSVTLSND